MKKSKLASRFTLGVSAALFAMQSLEPVYLSAKESNIRTEISSIPWRTDYQSALKEAQERGKLVVLFFTGSDWCSWCHRLEAEVLKTPRFAQLAQEDYIFVELDFPTKTRLDPRLKQQNDGLAKQYDVKAYPTLVLIDGQENVVGRTGYKQGGAEKYVAHLAELAASSRWAALQSTQKKPVGISAEIAGVSMQETEGQVQGVDSVLENHVAGRASIEHSFNALKTALIQAKENGDLNECMALIEKGLEVDENDYFFRELYTCLAKTGRLYDPYTRMVKEQLLENDLSSSFTNHYHVAITEFDVKSQELESGRLSASIVVEPLVEYAKNFSEKDKENVWRVEATIAEVFYQNDQYGEALKWATLARDHAPQDCKETIEKMILTIETDLKDKKEIARSDA